MWVYKKLDLVDAGLLDICCGHLEVKLDLMWLMWVYQKLDMGDVGQLKT